MNLSVRQKSLSMILNRYPERILSKFSYLSSIHLAFILSFLYWFYLACVTQMLIVHDAIIYENLGQILWKKGFIEYIKSGPTHEPIYPLLISLSMRIGNWLSTPYQSIQVLIQISFLFVTQVLTFNVLKILKINRRLIAFFVLYIGLSPALVNASLSLWSEIVVLPFVVALVLFGYRSWQNMENSVWDSCSNALGLGVFFLLALLVKGIFEMISFVFLLPFIFLLIKSVRHKETKKVKQLVVFLVVFCSTFYGGVTVYKSMNKKYNGVFTVADRGPWILYGNTARRVSNMTPKQLASELTFIAGEEICVPLFGEETCSFWNSYVQDTMGLDKEKELRQKNLSQNEVYKALIVHSGKKIFENLPQYIYFFFMENIKMLFWESTHVGFVIYPAWLQSLFDTPFFYMGLRLSIGLLTLFALIYAIRFVLRNISRIFCKKETQDQTAVMVFFLLLVILPFILLYSLFTILTRFVLPIDCLYLALIAFALSKLKFPHYKKAHPKQ